MGIEPTSEAWEAGRRLQFRSEITSLLYVTRAWERQSSTCLQSVEINVHERITCASEEFREPTTQPTI